jgi:GT2 family glycosyltransferase
MPAYQIKESDAFVVMSGASQPGGLMRLETVKMVGGIDEDFACCMDEDLQLRLLIHGPAYVLDGPGFIFRVRKEQKSEALTVVRVHEKLRIWQKIYTLLPTGDPRQVYRNPSRRFIYKWSAELLWRKRYYLKSAQHAFGGFIFRFK